jgi:hypothetical protein
MVAVVGSAPVLIEHPRLEHGVEDLPGEELVPGAVVEALHVGDRQGGPGSM